MSSYRASNAQKTKLYDMYVRFFRWASDRIEADGIVAFVSNSSFIHKYSFDGFRKVVGQEFSDVYVLDLGGDVRADPRLSGTQNNVFGIQTGVAISFLVKRAGAEGCRIHHARRPQLETAEEKLALLTNVRLDSLGFSELAPSAEHDWIRPDSDGFDLLLPLADRDTKSTGIAAQSRAIFKLYSLGVVTNRDDWAYDHDSLTLEKKVRYFGTVYERERMRWRSEGRPKEIGGWLDRDIK